MAFATADDVATRQGRTFTAAEEAAVDDLLDYATAAIAEAAGKDDAWAAALSPVPVILKGLTVELASRAQANYEGLTTASESLGAYSRTRSFNKEATAAFALTSFERRIVRRTVLSLNYEVRTPTYTEDFLEQIS